MKKQNTLKILTIFFIILFMSVLFSTSCYAADTDVINNYEIQITPRKNGTLFLTYTLDWKVLDSSDIGPLVELYVGVPNENVSEIKALSSNIKTINYTNNSYGANGHYLYITLNKKYYTNDVAQIKFSYVISHMYELSDSNCIFKFVPGWFDDVEVKNFKATCKATGVVFHNATQSNNTTITWQKSLKKGESINIQLAYPQADFAKLDPNAQITNTQTFTNNIVYDNYINDTDSTPVFIVFVILFIIILIFGIASNSSPRTYYKHSGYGYVTIYDDDDDDDYFTRSGYRSRYYHTRPPRHRSPRPSYSIFNTSSSWRDSGPSWRDSSSSSRSSSISSCACACACAGGGRAGCSKKELYHFNTKDLKNVLKK